MRLAAAMTLCVLCFCAFVGAEESERIYGSNSLRSNNELTTYRESKEGIPTYVEGNLSTEKAAAGAEFDVALRFFNENRGAFKMSSPVDELVTRKTQIDNVGKTHVRIDQVYQGLSVIGGELIAHFDQAKSLKTVNGTYYPEINIDTKADISEREATEFASTDLRTFFGSGEPGDAELVIFPWEDEYHLCWRLFIYSNTPMGRWEYFIDAKTGDVIFKANRIMDANDIGTGIGVMGDTRDHIDTDYTGSTYQMRDYTRRATNNPHGHDGQMASNAYIQTNIASTSLPGSIATDADNYWDNATTQRPAVDGQVYTGLVYDYLLSHFGRNGFDDNGSTMLTSVNYSAEGDNNAYWNGNQIVIWSWSSGWLSLAGCPDVIAHEWGHAVTETASDLVYQLESGALNESFSDMLGAAFEYAYPEYDEGDWGMGENGRTTGIPFRDMEYPHTYSDPDYYGTSDPYWYDVEGCSPNYLNDYCGVHTNSGVGNKWFSLLSDGGVHHSVTVTGIGVQDAILIAYQANLYYWTSTINYHNAALATISAANDLDPSGAWATQVSNAWNAVGVDTPGPSFTFDYPDGIPSIVTPVTGTSFEIIISPVLGGVLVAGSPEIHYSIDGAAYQTDALTQLTSTRYEATLPGDTCGSSYEFYITAEESTTGEKYDTDPSIPHTANAAVSTSSVFADDFETSTGWTVSGDASDGQWTRGVPAGGGERGDPPTDFDGSGSCYLTDNVAGNSDVDGGTTILTSPTFDLSGGNALIQYARWYSNDFGDAPNADEMYVYISNNNGSSWTLVETVGPVTQASGGWYEHSFFAGDFVSPLTNQMQVRFSVGDLGSGSVVEAGVDAFTVTQLFCSAPGELTIETSTLPDWTAGYPFSLQLEATGGQGTKTWTDKNGNLLGTGLTLSTDGVLSGTPNLPTMISFTAVVEDGIGTIVEQPLTMLVNDALVIITTSMPDWTVGVNYYALVSSTGGTGSTLMTDKYGDLSGTGLTLGTDGSLTGIPSVAGELSFTAEVLDGIGASAEHPYTITIAPAVSVDTDTLPAATEGVAYSMQLVSSGGTGNHLWSPVGTGLNGTGLSVNTAGILSGTPTLNGTISFGVRATDEIGAYTDKNLELTIDRAYVCGDASGSGSVDIGDAVWLVTYIFREGPAPDPEEAGDANCDGSVNVADAVHLINFIFKGGPAPCCP
ncbi:MAG: M4 family metallopeptidase [Candidatus Zixiibacteriota bacterium]